VIGTVSGAIRHPAKAMIISGVKIRAEYVGIIDLRLLCAVSEVKIVKFAMLAGCGSCALVE
jgi:hypothetical protein